jgi:hypothetical protein
LVERIKVLNGEEGLIVDRRKSLGEWKGKLENDKNGGNDINEHIANI